MENPYSIAISRMAGINAVVRCVWHALGFIRESARRDVLPARLMSKASVATLHAPGIW